MNGLFEYVEIHTGSDDFHFGREADTSSMRHDRRRLYWSQRLMYDKEGLVSEASKQAEEAFSCYSFGPTDLREITEAWRGEHTSIRLHRSLGGPFCQNDPVNARKPSAHFFVAAAMGSCLFCLGSSEATRLQLAAEVDHALVCLELIFQNDK